MDELNTIIQNIWDLAKPYLNTRMNDIHTEVSTKFACRLIEEEGGNENVILPAIILHDVGWKKVPEKLQLKAFGPKSTLPELLRKHEVEGEKIAKDILDKVDYDKKKTREILDIIDGHDSRKRAISLNDKIVKDSDKLWRYSKEGFYIDCKRFEMPFTESINKLRTSLAEWFFTDSAKKIALKELTDRVNELDAQS